MNGWNTHWSIHVGLSISIGNCLISGPYSHFIAKKSHPTAKLVLGGGVEYFLLKSLKKALGMNPWGQRDEVWAPGSSREFRTRISGEVKPHQDASFTFLRPSWGPSASGNKVSLWTHIHLHPSSQHTLGQALPPEFPELIHAALAGTLLIYISTFFISCNCSDLWCDCRHKSSSFSKPSSQPYVITGGWIFI